MMNIKKVLTLLLILLFLSSCSIHKDILDNPNNEYSGPYRYSEVQTTYPELYKNASEYIDRKNYKKAESSYREIISKEPNIADGYVGLATSLALQNREVEAIEVYNDALRIFSKSVDAYIGLGSVFYSLEMYDEALQSYSSALSIDANNPHGHWGKALALVQTMRYEEAIDHLNIVLDLVPNSPLAEHAERLLNETLMKID